MDANISRSYAGFTDNDDNNNHCCVDVFYGQAPMRHYDTERDILSHVQPQQQQVAQLHPLAANLICPDRGKDLSVPSNPNNQIAPTMAMPVATQPVGGSNPSGQIVPQRRVKITDELKREICVLKNENRSLKQADIATQFGLDRSTVSKILRDKTHFLSPDERCRADVEEELTAWIKKRRASVSIEQFRKKVLNICQDIPDISDQLSAQLLSPTWLEMFKQKHPAGFATENVPHYTETMMNSASLRSSPAISDGGHMLSNNSQGTSEHLGFRREPTQTSVLYQTINQPCGRVGLSSEFCQMPEVDAPALELPSAHFVSISPGLQPSRRQNHSIPLHPTDYLFHTADSNNQGSGRPTKENAQKAVATLLSYVNNGAGDASDSFAILSLTERLGLRSNADTEM